MRLIAFMCLGLLVPAGCFAGRYAMLVGNSDGGARYEHLRYVRSDIKAVKLVLTRFCGFSPDNIEALIDKGPADIDAKLENIKKRLVADPDGSVFLFYYTGHAGQEHLLMGDEEYALSRFQAHFDSLPSRIGIAVFDACRSGSLTRAKGGELAEPFLFRSEPQVQGRVILYSSAAGENSQESDMYGNSIFTFHFVNGLRGCGDASGDGKITIDEAYQYAYGQTVASTVHSGGGVQHPGYKFDIKGEGNVVLADLTVRTSGVILESGVEGKITILDRDQTLVAELEKQSGSRAMIALNPGAYSVFSHSGDSVMKATTRVRGDGVGAIRQSDFVRAKGFSARAKGIEAGAARCAFKLSAGYRFLALENVESAINAQLGDYSYFGMRPRLWLPDGAVHSGLEMQLTTKKNMLWFIGYEYSKFGREKWFDGARVNAFDGNAYGSRMSLSDTLKLFTVRIGAGYRLGHTPLKNLYGRIGLDFIGADFTTATTLSDSLFNVNASNSSEQKGLRILPHTQIGYMFRIWRQLGIGADIGYRYQHSPIELDREFNNSAYADPSSNGVVQEMPSMKFDFGGFHAAVYLAAEFRFAN